MSPVGAPWVPVVPAAYNQTKPNQCNFRGKYLNNLNCRFKCNEEKIQQHIFECSVITDKIGSCPNSGQYRDLH